MHLVKSSLFNKAFFTLGDVRCAGHRVMHVLNAAVRLLLT